MKPAIKLRQNLIDASVHFWIPHEAIPVFLSLPPHRSPTWKPASRGAPQPLSPGNSNLHASFFRKNMFFAKRSQFSPSPIACFPHESAKHAPHCHHRN
jgi:hypothetical protein